MNEKDEGTQESRTERAALALTPSEKRAVRVVAAAREISESELLRQTPIAAILEEYRRVKGALDEKGVV